MFRIEGTGEEIKGVVQKLTPRGNFRTQTGVRFRVLEKRAEGNGTHDSKADSFRESMVFTGMYKVVVFVFSSSILDSCFSLLYAWVFVLVCPIVCV